MFENLIMDNRNETKQKIIDTTVELLKNGIDYITVRTITELAGVNVSAVNYHFGSLYNLLSIAGDKLFKEIQNIFYILDNLNLSPEIRLKKFLIEYSVYAKKIKKIILQTLEHETFQLSSQESYFMFLKKEGFKKIQNVLKEITGKDENLDIFAFQSFIGILFPYVVLNDCNFHFDDFDFSDLEKQIDIFLSFIKK